jgi:glycosyltransferase involved in cell wall biosynthesis
MVGTLEARKNHLALLEAAESLWARGLRFELKLVGMLNRETGTPAGERIRELQRRGRPLAWPGALPESALMQALREADLFIYPSRYEGFGLPVLEALAHGLPCITSDNSALRELSGDGGILTCGVSTESITAALEALIRFPEKREALRQEALARPLRTMADVCADLRGHLAGLTQA